MEKIRVLIVDDAVVIRRLVTQSLSIDPQIEIVGAAANGKIALAKIQQVNPDIIIMDLEMPEMDGLQTLKEIRKIYPKLPVIIFSTLTERGASITLDALTFGANDYITKPANMGSLTASIQKVQEDMVPKIKAFCRTKISGPQTSLNESSPPVSVVPGASPQGSPKGKINILAIGVSTGGPNALGELIPRLPADFAVPVVVVQHMPPIFTGLLANRLNSKSQLTVSEAEPGTKLQPGHVLIAPGNFHMTVERAPVGACVRTNQDPPENSCRPSVDVLFRSVASVYGADSLAVVMTGMGQDGLRGCEKVRNAGGQILVQDEASSVVWGMPGFVAKAGLADKVVPLDRLSSEIISRVARGAEVVARGGR